MENLLALSAQPRKQVRVCWLLRGAKQRQLTMTMAKGCARQAPHPLLQALQMWLLLRRHQHLPRDVAIAPQRPKAT